MNLRGKKVLVLGMGETGLSMTKWLLRLGADVRVADSRTNPPHLASLVHLVAAEEAYLGAFNVEIIEDISLIALSPGVPLIEPVVQQALRQGIPVLGDIALFNLALKQDKTTHPKVLAITGSNGKTTVTAMVGAMINKAGWDVEVAGNIGPAVLDVLRERMDAGTLPQAWVLEVSSFQLETTPHLNADAAVVLNLSEDHLDRYTDMVAYTAAKANIFN
ncbi:MAG: Mur ligase family protein, partial [Nitrosomonas sp.]|nr:Mur ligase family protein [Nitrosomonas sp.]